MAFYHVDGQAGTGKSTIVRLLRARGYRAFDADRIFGYWGDPETRRRVLCTQGADWFWDPKKLSHTLSLKITMPVFICGCSANAHEFREYFKKVFTLYIDETTLVHRLSTRTTNRYGKDPEQLAYEVERNRVVVRTAIERGDVLIDATRPLHDVADEILASL